MIKEGEGLVGASRLCSGKRVYELFVFKKWSSNACPVNIINTLIEIFRGAHILRLLDGGSVQFCGNSYDEHSTNWSQA